MDNEEYKKQAEKLYDWIMGSKDRIFYINGHPGYGISTNGGRLILTEADGQCAGADIIIELEDIESMEFNKDDYQFEICTKEDGKHDGQGYDIEVYALERVEMGE